MPPGAKPCYIIWLYLVPVLFLVQRYKKNIKTAAVIRMAGYVQINVNICRRATCLFTPVFLLYQGWGLCRGPLVSVVPCATRGGRTPCPHTLTPIAPPFTDQQSPTTAGTQSAISTITSAQRDRRR